MQNNDENLISIDDIILRAKKRGVDFGKGDPRERLRYLTKIGLLPYAKRKSFVNGQPPNGAYPEYVIGLLEEINRKLKAGKSFQELKKEKERENLIETSSYTAHAPFTQEKIQEETKDIKISTEEVKTSAEETSSPVETQFSGDKLESLISKATSIFKVVFLFLIVGGIIFFFAGQAVERNFYSNLFASFDQIQRFTQGPTLTDENMPEVREVFVPSALDPYLTINAETDINGPLNVKEQITTPSLNLIEDEFSGTLISAGLTSGRTYVFPDLSGIVCLSTGNCVFETEEDRKVSSVGAIPSRLAKFLSSDEIGVSSIQDFYTGVALTIDSTGNVGIGTFTPRAKLEVDGNLITTGRIGVDISDPAYSLHVNGRIQATGDICTDLVGGRCLSTLPLGGGGSRGIGGSGTIGRLPIWATGNTLGDSIISQTGSIIDVAGTVRMLGFHLLTGTTTPGYVLTTDADGVGTWAPVPPAIISGLLNQTLRYDGTEWVGNYFLYNTGSAIGIGTTSTLAALTLSGDAIFTTTNLPQLALRYDDDNYLEFAIDNEQSLIEASKRLVLNSLTGEIRLGGNVNFFDAFGAEVWGATFISTSTDSTVRKSGELVFRASLPIFRYSVPSQTNSTTNTPVSKTFLMTDSLDLITPEQLPGTSRVYAFLINFADNIDTVSNSSWRVYRPSAGTEPFTFQFTGQGLIDLDIGNPHLTATTSLPDNDWRLDASVPSADRSIRIFNIFLLVFDQIN